MKFSYNVIIVKREEIDIDFNEIYSKIYDELTENGETADNDAIYYMFLDNTPYYLETIYNAYIEDEDFEDNVLREWTKFIDNEERVLV